jgi:hypothetical protein
MLALRRSVRRGNGRSCALAVIAITSLVGLRGIDNATSSRNILFLKKPI